MMGSLLLKIQVLYRHRLQMQWPLAELHEEKFHYSLGK